MKIDGDLAEIIGIHIGDGCLSRTKRYCEYYLGGDITEEKDYHNEWVRPLFNKKVMFPIFGKEVNYKEHHKLGIYGFHIFREEIVKFFENMGIKAGSKINIKIPQIIINNDYLSKRFLRGLFDTDGTIYFNKNKYSKLRLSNRPVIKLSSVSKELIDQVFLILKRLGFHSRLKKPYKGKRDKNKVYNLLVYRIGDVELFIRKIGFKNNKHYTKWLIYKNFGSCPANTTLKQRKGILLNPKLFNHYILK